MHIHRFSYDYAPPVGGLGPGVFELTRAQRALGHTLEVFAGEFPAQRTEVSDGLRVYRLPRTLPYLGPFFTYIPAAALRWMWAEAAPDIVHAHNHSSAHVTLASRSSRLWSYVLHLHATAAARRRRVGNGGTLLTRSLEWRGAELAERLACKFADAVVCVSQSVAEEAVDFYGVDPARLSVVQNGVNADVFTPHGPNKREELGLADCRVLLYVGALNPRKRLDLLITALGGLPDEYVLLVIGSGPDRRRLEGLVARLSLDGRVRFVGSISHDELPRYYRTADLFCLVSASEGLPKVILEALACAVPVVSTRSFRPAASLADAISWLDAPSPEALAEELAASTTLDATSSGRDLVLREFTWQAVAKRIEDVYVRVR